MTGSENTGNGETEAEVPSGPDILAELDTLYRISGNLSGQSGELCKDCTGYRSQQKKTAGQKEEYANWLTENKTTLEEHAWEALQTDLTELEECQKGDSEYIDTLEGRLRQNENVLLGIQELCRNGIEEPEQISAETLLGQLKGYQSQLLPEHYQLPSGGTTKGSPFAALREFASKGVLALVLPAGSEVSELVLEPAAWQNTEGAANTVSETKNTVSRTENTVSGTENTVSGAENVVSGTENTAGGTENVVSGAKNVGNAWKEIGERVLLLEYEKEHFGCYTDPGQETALCYEQEYLVIGSSKDRENLTGVVSELLAIRTMADFLQMLTKPEKVAQARQMAAAIAGVTGSSALIPVIKTGILLLWSVQEAVAEVKSLMAGEKVALYSDISALSLDYQGYLSLLRMVGSSQGLRLARLIEGTIQKRYQSSFQATDCAAALRMTLTAELKPHFFRNRLWRITECYELGYALK